MVRCACPTPPRHLSSDEAKPIIIAVYCRMEAADFFWCQPRGSDLELGPQLEVRRTRPEQTPILID